jgi:hypothetical protein
MNKTGLVRYESQGEIVMIVGTENLRGARSDAASGIVYLHR